MDQICPLVLVRPRLKWVSHLAANLITLIHLDFKARIFIKRNVFELTTAMLSEDSFPIVINIIKIQVTRLPNHRRIRVKFIFDWFLRTVAYPLRNEISSMSSRKNQNQKNPFWIFWPEMTLMIFSKCNRRLLNFSFLTRYGLYKLLAN